MWNSFGCQRLNAGFNLDEIRTVMGDSSIRTTQRCAKYQIEKLQNIIRGGNGVNHLLTPPKLVHLPEKINGKWLGDEESNLDSPSQRGT